MHPSDKPLILMCDEHQRKEVLTIGIVQQFTQQ